MSCLANLILITCNFLQKIADNGMLYGNLRAENILIRMNKQNTKILSVKFLNFGSLSSIEDSECIHIPD